MSCGEDLMAMTPLPTLPPITLHSYLGTQMSPFPDVRALSVLIFLTLLTGLTLSLPTVQLTSASFSPIQDSPPHELSRAPSRSLPKKDVTLREPRAKRELSRLTLVQYSSMSTVNGSANVSTPSLWIADDSHEFPIPHTHYSLAFGNLGSYLHHFDLETLLIGVRTEIQAEISDHGRNARLASTEYSKNLVDLQFWIQKMPWDRANLSWAELAIVVEGLWLYIVDERHDRETFIGVINKVTGRQIALGWIGRPHRPLEHTSPTGTVRRDVKALSSRQV